jgi:SAM-dependent methyltransferase
MSNSRLYDNSYFIKRDGTDVKRQMTFLSEKEFISKYVSSGSIMDIGCSTGEFLEAIDWKGPKFGMEISEHAIKIAKTKKISFEKSLLTEKSAFDLIVFRGTIQHIDEPFLYMKKSFDALKKGGYVVFLATPNANSFYYKRWNTLPFLDPSLNFFIPSDHSLINAMKNFGFTFIDIEYPYIDSPYSSLLGDHINFIMKILGKNVKFPFWRNSMNVVFQK